MIESKYLFTKKHCNDCNTTHHFDLDNRILCVHAIVRVGRYKKMLTDNQQALFDVIGQYYEKFSYPQFSLQTPLASEYHDI